MIKFFRFPTITDSGTMLLSANQSSQIYSTGYSDDYTKFILTPGWNQSIEISYEGPFYFSGTETGTTSNRLIDSSADFVAAGVQPGDIVKSLEGNKATSQIISVVSATELEMLFWNPVSGASYGIYSPSGSLKVVTAFTDAMNKAFSTKWTKPVVDVDLPSGARITGYNFS
jgi:hypothetical protein